MRDKTEIKTFNVRISKDLWRFLRERSITHEISMNAIIIGCLDKFKNRCEKRVDE